MPDLDVFYGPNAGYVLELYERYLENPASVDASSRAIFDTWSPIEQKNSEQSDGREPYQTSLRKLF